jgi:glycine cleavage system H protein
MNPTDLRYSSEHEWVRLLGDGTAEVGITEFAAESLGDVVYVELPAVGAMLTQFEKMGEIESVKAVSDLYTPVSGTVVEVNEEASDSPEVVNDGPYGAGWLIKVSIEEESQLDKLMSADQYQAFIDSQQ